MISSMNVCVGWMGVPSHKGISNKGNGAVRVRFPSLKSSTLVQPALCPFHLVVPGPLPPARQGACPLVQAAWTRRSSGQPPARKNKKSWGQRVDKYMKPFMLDINISKRYLHAKVVHRVTGKTVAVATTSARDLRNSLPSLIDANACKLVANILAERAKAADVFAVLYEPRRHEKLEGRLALILDTFLGNDITLVKS